MQSLAVTLLRRVERWLVGALPDVVRINVRVELLASLCYGLFFAASLSFFPVILRRLGATPFELSLYVVFSYVGQVLSPFGLALLRRTAPLRFTVVAWSISRGLLIFGAFLADAPWLLALSALFWIAEALPSPAYSRIMQEIYPPRFRGRAMSGVRIGVAVVVLIATPLAGLALDQVGHRPLFAIAAVFGVASSLIFLRVRPIAESAEPAHPPALRTLLPILRRDRRFALYLLVLTVYGFGGVMALPLYPLIQVSRLQLSYTVIGYLSLVQSLFWLLGFFVWGRLLDRFGPLWVLRASIIMVTFIPLTYIWAGNAWMLIPAFIFQGLVQGGFELGATNGSIELAERGRVLEYAALQTATLGVRGMLAPLLGTLLLGAGISESLVLALAAGLVTLSWIIMGALKPPSRESAEAA